MQKCFSSGVGWAFAILGIGIMANPAAATPLYQVDFENVAVSGTPVPPLVDSGPFPRTAPSGITGAPTVFRRSRPGVGFQNVLFLDETDGVTFSLTEDEGFQVDFNLEFFPRLPGSPPLLNNLGLAIGFFPVPDGTLRFMGDGVIRRQLGVGVFEDVATFDFNQVHQISLTYDLVAGRMRFSMDGAALLDTSIVGFPSPFSSFGVSIQGRSFSSVAFDDLVISSLPESGPALLLMLAAAVCVRLDRRTREEH